MTVGILTALAVLTAGGIYFGSGAFLSPGRLWVLPVGFAGAWLGLAILVFLLLWISCLFVDQGKPREQDSPYYRFLCLIGCDLARTLLRMRMEISGTEQVPKQGRFLLVCNHICDLDPAVILRCLPRAQLSFISKRENSSMFLVGKLMHMTLCQLVNRENDREALMTIKTCIRFIGEDKVSVGVFPEGYTSLDGKLHPFRNGVFKIAQRAKVPIVVCTVKGTRDVFGNMKHLRPTPVAFHVLGVIPASELEGVTTADIGERVHAMMAADLGMENVLTQE